MSVTVTFTPTNRDLVWASYAGLRARPLIFIPFVLLFVILPWFTASILIALGKPISIGAVMVLLVVPLITGAAFVSLPIRLYRNSPSLQGPHIYEFSESEIHLVGPGFDNRLQWSIVTLCLEFSGGLQFYSNRQPLISMPRRALSETNLPTLLSLLTAKGVVLRGQNA